MLCKSKYAILPRLRLSDNKPYKFELWIDDDTTFCKDVEELGRLALACKVKVKYNLFYPDKPIYWLSILCYMLDGNEINVKDISSKEDA